MPFWRWSIRLMGKARAQDLFGEELAICHYVMPGFALAHQVRQVVEADPTIQGVVLLRHGIFTWGEDARNSYERMIQMVTRAERCAGARRTATPQSGYGIPASREEFAARILPLLRGALAENLGEGNWKRVILERRVSPQVLQYLQQPELARFSQAGPATPDHVLRIKPWPLLLPKLAEVPPNSFVPASALRCARSRTGTKPISNATTRGWAAIERRWIPARGSFSRRRSG